MFDFQRVNIKPFESTHINGFPMISFWVYDTKERGDATTLAETVVVSFFVELVVG